MGKQPYPIRYIGVDPGHTGALSIVKFYEDKTIAINTFPFNKDGITEVDVIKNVFSLGLNKQAKITIEAVHSFRAQGLASTFTFGMNFGRILGVLDYMGLPYSLIHPQTWQRPFNLLVSKSLYTKERAAKILNILLGRELQLSDGEVDACLIAIASFIKDYPEKIKDYFGDLKIIKYDKGEDIETLDLERILGCR